jgi:anti-anti-sigma factor
MASRRSSCTAAGRARRQPDGRAAFQDRLLVAARAGAADVVVDFSEVAYISSAGLRALMAASKAKPKERRIAVAALNSIVEEIFAISRFAEVIPVFDTVEAASDRGTRLDIACASLCGATTSPFLGQPRLLANPAWCRRRAQQAARRPARRSRP